LKNKILAYAIEVDNNFAEFNAMLLQLSYLKKLDYEIDIMVTSKMDLTNYDLKHYNILKSNSYLNTCKVLNNSDYKYIYAPSIFSTIFIGLFRKFFNFEIIYWVQGVLPEESFLRNQSKIRYQVLSFLEKISLLLSDKHVFVSDAMVGHYLGKYGFINKPYTIISCSSDLEYQKTIIKIQDSFCYVGGMSEWQRVDLMLDLFIKIKRKKKNAIFYIMTRDKSKLKAILNNKQINISANNIIVDSISNRKDMQDFLSKMEYGFLLRDDIAVNNVSSPIKFAEYLSCGVNVIMSEAVSSYVKLIYDNKCGVIVKNNTIMNLLERHKPCSECALEAYDNNFTHEININKYKILLNEGR
jgi:glycosyltransferase involved in cell wall biosynthesis